MGNPFHEDKQEILNLFCTYLQATSNGRDISKIVYERIVDPDHPTWIDEHAVIYWNKEGRKPTRVDINGDGGTGMGKDILNKVFK